MDDPRKAMAGVNHVETGRNGERQTAYWYVAEGYRVLDANWRVREGEIDLVVERDGIVVFCEVKTRTSRRFGRGLEAVTWRKQRQVRALARQWLQLSPGSYRAVRFDVADVDGDGVVEVLEGCF